jgi:hypothetical protein
VKESKWTWLVVGILLGGTLLAYPVHQLIAFIIQEIRLKRGPKTLPSNTGANAISTAVNGGTTATGAPLSS